MKIELLSNRYNVRRLSEENIDAIYKLCLGNPLYYEYCPPAVTTGSIKNDLTALPPGISQSNKYYIGFYENENLVAVMDLIDGYPEKSIAFIGFFMTDISVQKKGIGSIIITDVCKQLKSDGFQSVRLAWVKGNPQAEHFWIKNHFNKIKETSSTAADSVILAERAL